MEPTKEQIADASAILQTFNTMFAHSYFQDTADDLSVESTKKMLHDKLEFLEQHKQFELCFCKCEENINEYLRDFELLAGDFERANWKVSIKPYITTKNGFKIIENTEANGELFAQQLLK